MKLDIVEAAEANDFVKSNDLWVRKGHDYTDELEISDTAQGTVIYLTRYNQNDTQIRYNEFNVTQTAQVNLFYRAIS